MTTMAARSIKAFWAPVVCAVVSGVAFAQAYSQQPSPSENPPAQAAKVRLNGEDVGTTEDPSVVVRRFTEILKRRTSKGGNFFIRAESGVRFSQVMKVVEAISHAHGIPDLAFEDGPAKAGDAGRGSVPVGGATLPRSQMLVVTVGDLGSTRGELI